MTIITTEQYVEIFNKNCQEFKDTVSGPIAKYLGEWYSVLGTEGKITHVGHKLNVFELRDCNVKNASWR